MLTIIIAICVIAGALMWAMCRAAGLADAKLGQMSEERGEVSGK